MFCFIFRTEFVSHFRRTCSDFVDMLRRPINWRIIIIIIIIINFNSRRAWLWYFQARYCTRLWCYSVVYYSNVVEYNQCWIGLYKSRPEKSDNSTYWLDGNPSTYRNWYPREPNQVEQCIRISNGKFRDGSCRNRYRYICKRIYIFLKVYFSLMFCLVLTELSVSFEPNWLVLGFWSR